MKRLVVLTGTLLALILTPDRPASGQQGYQIIVHKDNPAESLPKSTIADMFLKKQSSWESASSDAPELPVFPVDQLPKSPVREDFSRGIHGRSASSIASWWMRQVFSGREAPPPEVGSDAEVVAFVRSNRGAIGYVAPGTSLNGVKVLVSGG